MGSAARNGRPRIALGQRGRQLYHWLGARRRRRHAGQNVLIVAAVHVDPHWWLCRSPVPLVLILMRFRCVFITRWLCSLLLLAGSASAAETVRVTGLIREQDTNRPVAGAVVLVSSGKAEVRVESDVDGRYECRIPPGIITGRVRPRCRSARTRAGSRSSQTPSSRRD